MKWKKKVSCAARSCVALAVRYSVLGSVLLLQLPSPPPLLLLLTANYSYTIRSSLYILKMCVAYTCNQHIYSTGIYRHARTHYTDGDDYTRRTHERVRTAYMARCCCLDCLCCTDRITNTHSVDKLLGVFFFFISVHFARATLTIASTVAPLRIIQKLDGVARTIIFTIALHCVGIAKRIG